MLALCAAGALGCTVGAGGSGLPERMTLTATALSSTAIRLQWTPDSPAPTRYEIYEGQTFVGDVPDVGLTMTGLQPRTRHCYLVVSIYFPLGAASRSNEVCATTAGDLPPSAPTGLTATALSPVRVDLAWSVAGDDWGVAGYRVDRDGAPISSLVATSYSDEGPLPGSTHCYTVTATDTVGASSPPSLPACATTPPDVAPPTSPTGLSASANGVTTVTLRWNASADDARVAGYRLYRDGALAQTAGAEADLAPVVAEDPGLSAYTQYCYQVIAFDVAGRDSAPSEVSCVTTSWRRAVLAGPATGFDYVGERNALAVDGSGALHVAYSVQSFLPDANVRGYGPMALRYGTDATGAWGASPIASGIALGAVSLALDAAGLPHVSFCETAGPAHASSGDGWAAELVEQRSCGGTSLGFDGAGAAHLAYASAEGVRLATSASGAWSGASILAGNVTEPSLAIDAGSKLHVAFHDAASDRLGLVSDATGAWVAITADAGPGVGMFGSVAVDRLGHAHVAYYDAAHGDLKYATDAAGAWSARTVDAAGDVGLRTAIAVDGAGSVHVAYLSVDLDRNVFRLKYATDTGGAFATYELDDVSFGPNGWGDTSIAVEPDGRVHVTYFGGDGLRYATNR